jgi:hypothetical protein
VLEYGNTKTGGLKMGYETRMYVGVPYEHTIGRDLIQISGSSCAFSVYEDKGSKKGQYFFLEDGNTKRYVSGLKRKGTSFEIIQVQTMAPVFMVDLCKASYGATGGVIARGHKKGENLGCIFADNGNSMIAQDRYGAYMSFVPAKDVLAAMKEDNAKEPYRRLTVAIGALESAIASFPEEKLQVLFFGY